MRSSCRFRHILRLQTPMTKEWAHPSLSKTDQIRPDHHIKPLNIFAIYLSYLHLCYLLSRQDHFVFIHSSNLASHQEKLKNGSSRNKWNSGTGSVLTRGTSVFMATSVIWHQILLLHSCSLVYSTNKKHWKCLWLFTLETFLTVYQQRPPDGYPIMHDLHSSKKFLEFGLLYYHKPLRYIPYLKEAFTKTITSVSFFW